MRIRDYDAATDREAVVALLRANVPEHFFPDEEAGLVRFLDGIDALPGSYFAVENERGQVVAAGGIAADADGTTAALCWGMVHPGVQRRGIGSALLVHRLAAFLPSHPSVTRIRIDTSQKVRAFYERHGFVATKVEPEGYGPGLDRIFMERHVARD